MIGRHTRARQLCRLSACIARKTINIYATYNGAYAIISKKHSKFTEHATGPGIIKKALTNRKKTHEGAHSSNTATGSRRSMAVETLNPT